MPTINEDQIIDAFNEQFKFLDEIYEEDDSNKNSTVACMICLNATLSRVLDQIEMVESEFDRESVWARYIGGDKARALAIENILGQL